MKKLWRLSPRNMSLRTKLVVMLLPPLGLVLAYGAAQEIERAATATDLDRLASRVELMAVADHMVDELQAERGLSALYLGARGLEFGSELVDQRESTDSYSAVTFNTLLEAGEDVRASQVVTELQGLASHRDAVSRLAISFDENLTFYTELNRRLLGYARDLTRATTAGADLALRAEAYHNIQEMAETAGLERAVLGHALASGTLSDRHAGRLWELIGAQAAHLNSFITNAAPAEEAVFESVLGVQLPPEGSLIDPSAAPLSDVRRAVLIDRDAVTPDAAQWWDIASERITGLHEVGDQLVADLVVDSKERADAARRDIIEFAVVSLILVCGGFGTAFVVVGRLAKRTRRVTAAAVAVAGGELHQRAQDAAGDELGVLARAFNDMADRLTQLLHTKDEFIASVSHKLRTPLSAVVGFTDLLRGDSGLTAQEREEMMATVSHEAFDLGNIVEDLLVAARAEAGNLRVTRVRVDLRAQAAQVLEGFESAAGIEVVGDPPPALGDPARVRQILRNLISNALRHGGERVEVRMQERYPWTTLQVIDDGPGVPPEAVGLVFQAYYRTEAVAGVPGSVGLGLTVSRDLARSLGGDLVYRREDEHTIFELSLPAYVSDEDAEADTPADVAGAPAS